MPEPTTGPMPEAAALLTAADGGVRLAVRVTPRSGADRLTGAGQDAQGRWHLTLRLAAPPVEGAANAALTAFVARGMGLAKGRVRVVSGQGARLKMLVLAGDADDLRAALARWLASLDG